MSSIYRTLATARQAASLDCGFDPFRVGGWGRCTRATLATHGYLVDPRAYARREEAARALPNVLALFCWADDCGGREGDGELWDYDVSVRYADGRLDASGLVARTDLGRIQARSRTEATRLARAAQDQWLDAQVAS